MVPIAPFGIYGFILAQSRGMVALVYLVGMAAMIFTAFSYASMSRAFPVAGSVYSYAGRGIHAGVGFVAGWAILLDYILVPSLLYIVGGTAMTSFVPAIPAWAWVLAFIAFNTVINLRGMQASAKFNRLMLVAELAVLGIFVVIGLSVIAAHRGGAAPSIKPLYDGHGFSLSLILGAVSVAVLSFLGFDGISTLSEETRGGAKTVGRATVSALLIVGLLFMVQTWVAAMAVPQSRLHNPNTAFYDAAGIIGGHWLAVLTAVATAVAWGIANALAAQAATSRLLFSMARDRKLPRLLSKVHPRTQVPINATLLVAAISVIVGLALVSRIAFLTSIVNFGALFAFMLLHISVVTYYVVRRRSRRWFAHLISPVLGFVIIAYVWVHMDIHAKIGGFTWLAVGLVVLLVFRLRGKDLSLPEVDETHAAPPAAAEPRRQAGAA
ncbi:MAG: APC family permease [Streptosporangiaceae bacterium]|nr:APC family permease [Streptosporangiaceae bacterium]